MNNSSFNIKKNILLLERYQQNCQVVSAASGMNWLIYLYLEHIHGLKSL